MFCSRHIAQGAVIGEEREIESMIERQRRNLALQRTKEEVRQGQSKLKLQAVLFGSDRLSQNLLHACVAKKSAKPLAPLSARPYLAATE